MAKKPNDELKIEKGVPIPKKQWDRITRGRALEAFQKMRLGDSVVLPSVHLGHACRVADHGLGRGNYTARPEKNGIRVWRIK